MSQIQYNRKAFKDFIHIKVDILSKGAFVLIGRTITEWGIPTSYVGACTIDSNPHPELILVAQGWLQSIAKAR